MVAATLFFSGIIVCLLVSQPTRGTTGIGDLLEPGIGMGAVMVASRLYPRRGDRLSDWLPWTRGLVIAALAFEAVRSLAAIHAAVQLGDGRLAPACAHAVHHLAGAAAVAGGLTMLAAKWRRA